MLVQTNNTGWYHTQYAAMMPAKPKFFTQEAIHGAFYFDATPRAPLGTKCCFHVKLQSCSSWGLNVIDAFYVSPALHHHQCYHTVISSMGAECISKAVTFQHTTRNLEQALWDYPLAHGNTMEAIQNLNMLLNKWAPSPSNAPPLASVLQLMTAQHELPNQPIVMPMVPSQKHQHQLQLLLNSCYPNTKTYMPADPMLYPNTHNLHSKNTIPNPRIIWSRPSLMMPQVSHWNISQTHMATGIFQQVGPFGTRGQRPHWNWYHKIHSQAHCFYLLHYNIWADCCRLLFTEDVTTQSSTTVGCDHIDYPCDVCMPMADFTTTKLLFHYTISMQQAWFFTLDVKIFEHTLG